MPFKKILVAVDESAESLKAARSGFELAHNLKASVGVLYVVNKDKEVVNADLGITPEESMNAMREEANKTIEQMIKMYDGIGEVVRFTPEGAPGDEILKLAAEWPADCIVMGTHARGKIEQLFAGSVMEQVIRAAEIPVLVAPPNMK